MNILSPKHWIPVALSDGLARGEVRPATAADCSIALWRGDDGVAHATDTRCPHRGMNLAYGFVRDNQLACAYHGWRYDAGGHCMHIPAHPELPPARSIHATVYACEDSGGLIWVWPESAPASVPVPTALATAPVAVRSVVIETSPARLREALSLADDVVYATHDGELNPCDDATTHRPLVLGLQSLSTDRCCLHVLVAENNVDATTRVQVARSACRLRDRLELNASEAR